MRFYLLKRLLLIIPTLLGITIACFLIMQTVPGGPVEQALQKIKQAQQKSGLGSGGMQVNMTQDELENIKRYYGFDKPVLVRYFLWLESLSGLTSAHHIIMKNLF